MRKILSISFLLLLTLTLVACKKGGKGNLEIINTEFSGNTYTVTVNFDEELTTEDEILEVAYSASSLVYNELQDEIGLNKRILIIKLESVNLLKITLTYTVNNSLDSPGLTLVSEELA